MSLFSKVSNFAKSEQGKKLIRQAEDVAKDPKTKEKIEEVRERFAKGKKDTHAGPQGGAKPPPKRTASGG